MVSLSKFNYLEEVKHSLSMNMCILGHICVKPIILILLYNITEVNRRNSLGLTCVEGRMRMKEAD